MQLLLQLLYYDRNRTSLKRKDQQLVLQSPFSASGETWVQLNQVTEDRARGMEEWIQMLSEMEQGCDPSQETTDKLTTLIRLSLQDDIRYNNN